MIKSLPAMCGDLGFDPLNQEDPGEGHSKPTQYSWLKNSMDSGARWATAQG